MCGGWREGGRGRIPAVIIASRPNKALYIQRLSVVHALAECPKPPSHFGPHHPLHCRMPETTARRRGKALCVSLNLPYSAYTTYKAYTITCTTVQCPTLPGRNMPYLGSVSDSGIRSISQRVPASAIQLIRFVHWPGRQLHRVKPARRTARHGVRWSGRTDR